MWMREERAPKKMLNTQMEGKRPTRRPRTTFIDQVRKDIQMRVITEVAMYENRQWENRDVWRFLRNSLQTSLETTQEL